MSEKQNMSAIQHLEELRRRIIIILAFFIVFLLIAFLYVQDTIVL
jgi:sec-independent protein translocase protein TatC